MVTPAHPHAPEKKCPGRRFAKCGASRTPLAACRRRLADSPVPVFAEQRGQRQEIYRKANVLSPIGDS